MEKDTQKMNDEWKVMIRYSQKEQQFTATLAELLINIGIKSESILCGSLTDHLVLDGVDFYDYPRNYMGQEYIFVIFFMFYNCNVSAYCQNECK